MFYVLEGLDASGKFTQSENLKAYFVGKGQKVVKFDFPKYESVTGEMIRDYLKGFWKVDTSVDNPNKDALYQADPATYLFQCCHIVNRMETLPDGVWNRDSDEVYIADRYNASAYAYGMAFGLDFDWLIKIHKHLPQPDINIFLDISVEESFRRRPDRRDNYERNARMLEDVRAAYLSVFKRLGPSYVVIDGAGPIDVVQRRILDVIESKR